MNFSPLCIFGRFACLQEDKITSGLILLFLVFTCNVAFSFHNVTALLLIRNPVDLLGLLQNVYFSKLVFVSECLFQDQDVGVILYRIMVKAWVMVLLLRSKNANLLVFVFVFSLIFAFVFNLHFNLYMTLSDACGVVVVLLLKSKAADLPVLYLVLARTRSQLLEPGGRRPFIGL